MSDRVFVDTNVLVYARDATVPGKQERAAAWLRHLWGSGTGRVSYQVLQEYFVTVTQRLTPGMPTAAARGDVRDLTTWNPVAASLSTMEAAWAIQDRYQLSWWDALIVASAQEAGCSTLLTEDLQHGLQIGDLAVVSPFEAAPPA